MEKVQEIQSVRYQPTTVPDTRTVGAGAPLDWLRRGARDFAAAPMLSMGYGALFALLAMGITYASAQRPQLALVVFTLLLLVGPFLATGLYLVARSRERGDAISAGCSLSATGRTAGQVAGFVALMLLMTVAWIRLSSVLVAVYSGQLAPDVEVFARLLGSPEGLALLGLLMVIAGGFALLLFAASALTLPMIVDRRAEMIPACIASIKTVLQQPGVMLTWAALIAGLTALGLATLYVGLIVVFPVLGYATWHSYRDLVD